jgi:hypothetical protein
VNDAVHEFLVVVDSTYLPRVVVIHRSLAAVTPAFSLRIYCMDETTERVLQKLALSNARIVGLAELEQADPGLAKVRPTRSRKEYCQTAKPAALLHALRREPALGMLTLLDADLYFYSDPGVLLDELRPEDSILLVPHRHIPEWAHWSHKVGEYNTGFVTFRNDARARAALRWWRERCLEWCYDRFEPGRFTDQRYVHDWPTTRPGVRVLRHPGGGLAPWNMPGHQVELHDGKIWVDGLPLVFFHFQSLGLYRGAASMRRYGLGRNVFELTSGAQPTIWAPSSQWAIPARDKALLWRPYVHELADGLNEIREVEPSFNVAVPAPGEMLLRAAGRPLLPRAVRRPLYHSYVALRRGVAGTNRARAKAN